MTKTAVISGLHLRMDVPTKCKLVELVLTKSFSSKKEQNAYIELLASQHFVNPITIKLWCGKYQNTWKFGKALPKGTMSFAFATVPDYELPTVTAELKNIRDNLTKLVDDSQTDYHGTLTADDIKKTRTPGEVLDELVTGKKG